MTERHEPRYFPALCPAGHRPFLALVNGPEPSANHFACPVCGAEGRVIPGAYYTEQTRHRFERVASVLYEARLTREQTATVVAWLDRAARDFEASTEAVLTALGKVPGLGALESLVPSDRHERHGFVGLTLALLTAGATAPAQRGSGERPVPGVRQCEELPRDDRELEQQVG